MIRLNVQEAKTHLSRYLDRVERGETIVLCRRNVPVAELRPVARQRQGRRPIGLDKGRVKVSKSFFKPLPKRILDAFEGK